MASRLAMLICVIVFCNIYVCHKYTSAIVSLDINFPIWLFRLTYFAIVALFYISIFYEETLSGHALLHTVVTYLVTVYLGIFMVSLPLFFGFDIAFLISRFLRGILPFVRVVYAEGLTVLLISLLLTGFGLWNARQISLKQYAITIAKPAKMGSIRLVMLGDIHLGTSIKEKELDNIVNTVNALSPDIVAITGDLFDHSTTPQLMDTSVEILSRLNARFGTYYVFGNHEHYLGDIYKATEGLRGAVKFLNDDTQLIDDSFYLVGRDDPTYKQRKKIGEIMSGLDTSKPVILIEHQPNGIDQNIAGGVDLQLSGHTHSGQLFPFNILVKAFNSLFYGHYIINGYQAIVTSGTGVWRFPIRVGSKCEIVCAEIYFGTP